MKRLLLFLLLCLAVPVSAGAQVIDAPFDRLQDKAWAVVITGSEFDPLYLEQISYFMPAAEIFVKREIVTIHFKDRSLDIIPELTVFKYQLPRLRENRDTNLLESQLQTDDDVFSVVLVNKAGSTQYVWSAPVRPEALFSMMDTPVPMVQPENLPEPEK